MEIGSLRSHSSNFRKPTQKVETPSAKLPTWRQIENRNRLPYRDRTFSKQAPVAIKVLLDQALLEVLCLSIRKISAYSILFRIAYLRSC